MKNVETIKQLYQLFQEKDYEKIRHLFASDIKWEQMRGFPGGGTFVGADAILQHVFDGFRENWSKWKVEVTEYLEAEKSVFVIGYYLGTFKSTGRSVKAKFTHRYKIKNGKITKFTQFTDTFLIAQAMKVPLRASLSQRILLPA